MTEKTGQDVTFLQHLAPFSDVNVIGQTKISSNYFKRQNSVFSSKMFKNA